LKRLCALAVISTISAQSAQALTINPTFNNVDANAQSVIMGVIAGYAATFSDNVSVNITFQGMTSGLGQSSTNFYSVDYATWISRLRSDATSSTDTTALNSIPAGANPLPNISGTNIYLTRASANAVGFNFAANGADSTIGLNFGAMNYTRTGTIDPAKYDLQNTVQHEINEVLGTVSGVSSFAGVNTPMDMFRYSAPGVRSFGVQADKAYFSINGGTTNLAGYNNQASGDSGDFDGTVLRVQNAFGTPGASTVQMGVEITMLDAIGYNVSAVPEPATYLMWLAGLSVVGLTGFKRRQS